MPACLLLNALTDQVELDQVERRRRPGRTGQILSAWIAKEELRALLSTVRVGGDPHLTRHRLHRFLAWCIDSQISELLTSTAPQSSTAADPRPARLRRTHQTVFASTKTADALIGKIKR